MWNYFKIEVLQFFTNRKNIAIYTVLLAVTLFFCFRLAPAYDPIEKIDEMEIESRLTSREAFLKQVEGKLPWEMHSSVVYAIEVFKSINPHDAARLEALEAGDYKRYAQETAIWYEKTIPTVIRDGLFTFNPRYYSYNNLYAQRDAEFSNFAAYHRMEHYGQVEYTLSREIVDGRTAMQTLERLLQGPLPLILYVAALFLIVDIVTKDRRNKTLLRGFPITDWKKLLVKAAVSLVGIAALFVPLLIGFVIIGLQSGFGHFKLPVIFYDWTSFLQTAAPYKLMSTGDFLAKTFALMSLWFAVLVLLVLLCSIVLHQEMLNLVVGLAVIFGESIYFSRSIGFIWDVHNSPLSYLQAGQVVSGWRKYLYEAPPLDFALGMKLAGGCALVLLIVTVGLVLMKRFKMIR